MKLFKIRLGQATNSSSTHSVVFWKGKPPSDDPMGRDYGWEDFTLSSPEEKAAYLESMWYTATGEYDERRRLNLPGIDHQSVWNIPSEVGSPKPSKRFFDALSSHIVNNPKLGILGGNDNSDGHPLLSEKRADEWSLTEDLKHGSNSVIREDPVGNYWTFMCSGWRGPSKYRFALDGSVPDPKKAFSPELLDLKITDYCSYGCSFCYQGSTKRGKHASWESLQKCAETMKKLQVMEVAIGGGEPTQHPDLERFLDLLKSAGIRANVTTKNRGWVNKLRNSYLRPEIGIGLSISSAKEVCNLGGVTNHVVLGETPLSEVYAIVSEARQTLLLDWKFSGRGKRGPKEKIDGWLDVVRAHKAHSIVEDYGDFHVGIDTPLAKRYSEELKNAGIPEILYETEEGKFSGYWDLVTGKIGPSSYDPASLVEFDGSAKGFLREFAKW